MSDLAKTILSDLEIRSRNAEQPGDEMLPIPDLYDVYGPAALDALAELRRARLVRFVACGDPLGWDLSKCIRGENEIYTSIELPQ